MHWRFGAVALALAIASSHSAAAPGLIPNPQDSAEKAHRQTALEALAPKPNDHGLGDPNAPVRWVIYGSLGCSHCATLMRTVLPALRKGYVDTGLVYVVWRDFPLSEMDYFAAMAANCGPRERFFDTVDALLREQARWAKRDGDAEEMEEAVAAIAGLDESSDCFASDDVLNHIADQSDAAKQDLGVEGTPTSFIDGERIVGVTKMEDFDKALKRALLRRGKEQLESRR